MSQTIKPLPWVFRIGTRIASIVIALLGLGQFQAVTLPAAAQTVSGVSPLVSSGSYTISSSPLPNGGRVQTVHYPASVPQGNSDPAIALTASRSQFNHRPVQTIRTSTTMPASTSVSLSRNPMNGSNDGWQSVSNRSEIVTTMYQEPVNSAPQLRSVPPSQMPVIGNSTTSSNSSDYYSRTTSNFQGGVPAASTPPTLAPNGTTSSNPSLMGQSPASVVTAQPQNGLNWQPVNGNVVYPSGFRYTPNGVCTPVNAQYVNATPPRYKTYKPLIPRRMPCNTYLGQGLYGQPRAYVQGQNVRNFFRYLVP